MDKPNVSICIPTFDDVATIAATLDSLLTQTYKGIEIRIVDAGSTDDTLTTVKGFDDPRITIDHVDPSLRRVDHWTKAIELSTGAYVKLMLPGDRLAPTCIERQVAAFEAAGNENVVLTAVRRTVLDRDGNVLMQSRGLGGMKGRLSGNDVMRKMVRSGTNPLGEPAAVLVRGDIFRSSMPWNDELDYMIDIDMWTRILAHGELFAIPESLTSFLVASGETGEVAGNQRKQAVDFMKKLQISHPNVISSTDVKIGAAQAALLAQGRRATYWYIDRKK